MTGMSACAVRKADGQPGTSAPIQRLRPDILEQRPSVVDLRVDIR
jgi:hypothetical protein